MSDFITNYGILASYLLLAIAVLGAIGFPIIELAKNPKGAKGAQISSKNGSNELKSGPKLF